MEEIALKKRYNRASTEQTIPKASMTRLLPSSDDRDNNSGTPQ
jgi:hypothetical protein